MRVRKLAALAAAFALSISLAQAETVTRDVGGTGFNFAVPRGFCVLSDNNSRDAIFINVLRTLLKSSGNKLIVTAADCTLLKAFRDGDNGNLTRYATYYLPLANEGTSMPGETAAQRAELCREMRKQGDATLAQAKEAVAKAAQELHADIALGSSKYIGVIDEDEHGCYAALLIGAKGPEGRNTVMSGIVATTVIQGKPLFFAIYNEYKGPGTTQEDVDRSKIVLADLDRANR